MCAPVVAQCVLQLGDTEFGGRGGSCDVIHVTVEFVMGVVMGTL